MSIRNIIRDTIREELYHATYAPLLDIIKKEGLGGPSSKPNWSDSKQGVVYLSTDPNVAESYAEAAEDIPEDWLDQIIILKIDRGKLDPDLLFKDENVRSEDSKSYEYHGIIKDFEVTIAW